MVKPYFSYLYGQKRSDISKFDRIHEISKHISNSTLDKKTYKNLASELIQLVYSTNPEGQVRKVSLNDKLALFNCVETQNFLKKL